MILWFPNVILLLDLKIIWIMLIVHKVGNPPLATKLNSFAMGSHRSFVAYCRNSSFSLWMSYALWFARSFIVTHTSPYIKTFGSWVFGIKRSLLLCHEVYNFVQQFSISCSINGSVELLFYSKFFPNNFGSLFFSRRWSSFSLRAKWEHFLYQIIMQHFLKAICEVLIEWLELT